MTDIDFCLTPEFCRPKIVNNRLVTIELFFFSQQNWQSSQIFRSEFSSQKQNSRIIKLNVRNIHPGTAIRVKSLLNKHRLDDVKEKSEATAIFHELVR